MAACLSCLLAAVAGAQQVVNGDGRRFYPDDPLGSDPDALDVGVELPEHEFSQYFDFAQNLLTEPGADGAALNVNTLGEVPDSSWFQNRLGTIPLSGDDIVRGPNRVDGPAPGTWLVVGRPGSGITPKFTIQDERGDRYLIKLDPPGASGLSSTAEVVSTKLFWAIGYNTPENYITFLDPGDLQIQDGATWTTYVGRRRPILDEDLEEWLRGQPRGANGRIRVLASRFIDGRPVGHYNYHGTRSDDLNDIFAHEARRELRGLRAFSAWLNHDDSRSVNTFNAEVEVDGRRFIRHFLIDFGSTLGSGSVFAQERRAGYEFYVEVDKVLKRMLSFGLLNEGWEGVRYPEYTAVGRFEADFYEPWKWKSQYPNAAFDRMDAADAFWAAGILARFTDDMIARVVRDARMPDPAAEEYLIRTLVTRLEKTVDYWLTRTNPVDRFEVVRGGGGVELQFDNAAIREGAAAAGAEYAIAWSRLDNLANRETPAAAEVRSAATRARVPDDAWGPADDAGYRYAVATVAADHPDFPHWSRAVKVTLRDRAGDLDVVGIERPRMTAEFAREEPDGH